MPLSAASALFSEFARLCATVVLAKEEAAFSSA
jgi:hypothetical protein